MTTTPTNIPFRTRVEASQTPKIEVQEAKGPEVTDSGHLDQAITPSAEFKPVSELEKWEIQNGKYGLEYLGIKEIAKEFPVKAEFSYIDNFIKSEIKKRGLDSTPENWQNILSELENEAGTDKKDSFKRINKLFNFIKLYNKYMEIKEKKDNFRING